MADRVALESAILSPPRTQASAIAASWNLSETELRDRPIYFMADAPAYMEALMTLVRG